VLNIGQIIVTSGYLGVLSIDDLDQGIPHNIIGLTMKLLLILPFHIDFYLVRSLIQWNGYDDFAALGGVVD
jgi:hypothetical protein